MALDSCEEGTIGRVVNCLRIGAAAWVTDGRDNCLTKDLARVLGAISNKTIYYRDRIEKCQLINGKDVEVRKLDADGKISSFWD